MEAHFTTQLKKRTHERGAIINSELEYKEGLKLWVGFWRENPHRFLKDVVGVTYFKPFQEILLYEMFHNSETIYTASRGQGKSEVTSWAGCVCALLYPNSEIIITSGSKKQANLLISTKIRKFANDYPVLGKAITYIGKKDDDPIVEFSNGSTITVVTPSDNSRGYRATFLILDEYRMIKKDVIETVLKRFISSNRTVKFMEKPEYKNYPLELIEPSRTVYMSSCWFKSHWSWDKFVDDMNKMLSFNAEAEARILRGEVVEVEKKNLKPFFVCNLPYTLPLYEGFLPLSVVEQEMDADDFNEIKWMMEMEALFYGESESAYYKTTEIEDIMNIRDIFIPPEVDTDTLKLKKGMDFSLEDKIEGEVRVLSIDVGEAGNDNDVYVGIRLVPIEVGRGENKKWVYTKNVVYLNHISCEHPDIKAIYAKRLYADFQADWVVMDTNGTSAPLYYSCNRKTVDEERGVIYPAWTTIEDTSKLGALNYVDDALPIVWSVRAYPQFNHECANFLRSEMRAKRLQLPLKRTDALEEFDVDIKGFVELDAISKEKILKTYTETYLLLIELTNLEAVFSDKGLVSIEKPVGGKVKRDRYSALSYGIWFCCKLETENLNRTQKKRSSFSCKYSMPKHFIK